MWYEANIFRIQQYKLSSVPVLSIKKYLFPFVFIRFNKNRIPASILFIQYVFHDNFENSLLSFENTVGKYLGPEESASFWFLVPLSMPFILEDVSWGTEEAALDHISPSVTWMIFPSCFEVCDDAFFKSLRRKSPSLYVSWPC